jgi:hypothetical protein
MALRLVEPRKGNPNWQIRGTYLHVKKFYRSAKTPEKDIAEQVLLKIKKEIEWEAFNSEKAPRWINVSETWKKIPGCSLYEVSNLGHVRRRARGGDPLTTGCVLKPTHQRSGHLLVSVFRDDGTQWRQSVHRLVAIAFLGPAPSSSHMACHKNGYPADCRAVNLYWGTISDNALDARRHRMEGRTGFPWNSDPYDRGRGGRRVQEVQS